MLEAQEYIAAAAKPGVWLRNKERPEASLHHMAVAFFESRGYAKYFPHSIGHFLGLDVHDVGDYSVPLQEGDIITIEPGLYLPEEQLGVLSKITTGLLKTVLNVSAMHCLKRRLKLKSLCKLLRSKRNDRVIA